MTGYPPSQHQWLPTQPHWPTGPMGPGPMGQPYPPAGYFQAPPRPANTTRIRRPRLPLTLVTVAVVLVGALGAVAWQGVAGTTPGFTGAASTGPTPGFTGAASTGTSSTSTPFCELARQGFAQQSTALADENGDLSQMIDRATELNHRLLAVAPEEIRADLETISSTTDQLAAVVKRGDLPGPETVALFRSPEFTGATTNVAQHLRSRCGITASDGAFSPGN